MPEVMKCVTLLNGQKVRPCIGPWCRKFRLRRDKEHAIKNLVDEAESSPY